LSDHLCCRCIETSLSGVRVGVKAEEVYFADVFALAEHGDCASGADEEALGSNSASELDESFDILVIDASAFGVDYFYVFLSAGPTYGYG